MLLVWGWLACGVLVLLMLGCAHAGMSWTGAKPVRARDVLPRSTPRRKALQWDEFVALDEPLIRLARFRGEADRPAWHSDAVSDSEAAFILIADSMPNHLVLPLREEEVEA